MSKTVAIVGRPNVGKSTLFNRVTEQRKAIVDDTSGVTRDRIYGIAEWQGLDFNLIDTGGFVANPEDVFEKAIKEQVHIAMDESDLIIFMVDVTTGVTDQDDAVTRELRKGNKPVLLAVNKVDNYSRELEANVFYRLGFADTFFLSSMSGSGTGELLEAVKEKLGVDDEETEVDSELPRFAIIGQPNVGKSSLLNALIGQERNIVTDIAGTTRDAIHTTYNYYNKKFILTDTAGLRKKAKEMGNIEFYSVIRAIRAMDYSDICLLLIDAKEGLQGQDLNIFRLAVRKRKGLVLLVNKWDLVEKDHKTHKEFEEKIREKLAPFRDIPILFISATEKTRIFKAMETALEVYKNMHQKIPTSRLNEVMQEAIMKNPPPSIRGKYIKIKYITQLPTKTPVIAFFCNYPMDIKLPYINYLENQLRKNFPLSGVSIKLVFRKK